MQFCVDFFQDLIKRLNCCKRKSFDTEDNEHNVSKSYESNKAENQRSGINFLNRLFNNKPKRFENYRPTKKYRRNRSKEEMIYLERAKDDESVHVFQINKSKKPRASQLLCNDN